MRKIRIPGPLAAGLLLVVHSVAAADSHQAEPHGLDAACVLRWAEQAAGSTTLDEIRAQCALTPESTRVEESAAATEDAPLPAVEKRLAADRQALDRPFTIMAHRPNYFLVAAWNERGWDPTLYQEQSGDPAYENDDVESQFQISLKVPLAVGLYVDAVIQGRELRAARRIPRSALRAGDTVGETAAQGLLRRQATNERMSGIEAKLHTGR
mgnify:CR=1 FL=1